MAGRAWPRRWARPPPPPPRSIRRRLRSTATATRPPAAIEPEATAVIAPRLRTLVGRLYEHHCIAFLRANPFRDIVSQSTPSSQDDDDGEAEEDRRRVVEHAEIHDAGLGVDQVFHSGVRGSQDQGLDARGSWTVPSGSEGGRKEVRLAVQCKIMRGDVKLVREMEGLVGWENVLSSRPDGALSSAVASNPHMAHRLENLASSLTLGVVFSSKGFTSRALEKARATTIPLLLVHLDAPPLPPTVESLSSPMDDDGSDPATDRSILDIQHLVASYSHHISYYPTSPDPFLPFRLSLAYLNPSASHALPGLEFRRLATPHFSVRSRRRPVPPPPSLHSAVESGEESVLALVDAAGEEKDEDMDTARESRQVLYFNGRRWKGF